jgi:amino acid adenylation domain-containing protein
MSNAAPTIANQEMLRAAQCDPQHSELRAENPRVTALIAKQARSHPSNLALAMGSNQLTYSELESRSSQLAAYLHSLGTGSNALVALCLERSPEFVIAALAILKSGAAYLPMDPKHPAERLQFMANDAAVGLIVTQARFAQIFAHANHRILALDTAEEAIKQHSSDRMVEPSAETDDLAYVIYTSGSTGQPKGVEITHHNLSNLVAWHIGAFGVNESTRMTFQAGVGFDAAVWEIWPALVAGASVHLPDESTRMVPVSLRDWLVDQQITISFAPTAVAEQLINLPWPPNTALRVLLTGADTLQRFPKPGLPFALINNYGPTECTVVTSSGVVPTSAGQVGTPSIGSPIANVRVHIMDDQRREVPSGEVGEIYIGGAGVALGYRNRPDLTSTRFPADPSGSKGERLYRTGDLARRLPNGEIAFIGRIDDQIKIRGYRIEPGEICAVLNQLPSITASIVVAHEDAAGDKWLVAYLVSPTGSSSDNDKLRDAIRRQLPNYMEPAAFVWTKTLPLGTNGKIDRSALPPPEFENASGEFVAPRTPVEEALSRIISNVLKLPRVSIHDDFFHLGAHSLLGAQIIAKVRNAFGTELKLLDVFDAPTVASLAERVEESLMRQLNGMSEAEVNAALAAFDQPAVRVHSQ